MSASTLKSSMLQNCLLVRHDLAHCPWFRSFSSGTNRLVYQSADFSSTSKSHDKLGRRAKEKLLDREFFLSLLSSASTKREAKSYLARFKKPQPKTDQNPPKPTQSNNAQVPNGADLRPQTLGANLGSFYGASRTVKDSPVFRQYTTPQPDVEEKVVEEKLHLALVKITSPQTLATSVIDGVAKTLAQLNRLGMACCVVVDPGPLDDPNVLRKIAIHEADRLGRAVDAQPDSKSIRLDSLFTISSMVPHAPPTVSSRKILLKPLRDGHTVIVPPIGYTVDTPRAISVPADDAVLSLVKELAGLARPHDPDEDPLVTADKIQALQRQVSLDRIILLDPLGGIPALSGPQTSHVFINMEQEIGDIENELRQMRPSIESSAAVAAAAVRDSTEGTLPKRNVVDGHLDNLHLSHKALLMLPSTSSGIIASPKDVANSAQPPEPVASDVSAVGTRRQRNPLIHNLLTDKPLLSSSLPLSRRGVLNGSNATHPSGSHTTFVKRGMPLSVFPDPRVETWSAHQAGNVKLTDPSIDLPRLVYLIEDSFNHTLDVQDYLHRVNDRLAGVIIAGEYEGGAILTWELPPGVPDDGSEASRARMVPYLDKFAVLKRSQGAGGVADMVFNAMVRTCFPNGVCWRSRKDNPVNKWYFERSRGTWKLADTNWTMFWTTPGLANDRQKLQDYEAVCRSIEPSWADNTGVID